MSQYGRGTAAAPATPIVDGAGISERPEETGTPKWRAEGSRASRAGRRISRKRERQAADMLCARSRGWHWSRPVRPVVHSGDTFPSRVVVDDVLN